MSYTILTGQDIWQFHYVTEQDRSWLEEALEGSDYTAQQAIDFGAEERVDAPEVPPFPSFYVSRIYSRTFDPRPVAWLLNRVHGNVNILVSFLLHPEFRGQNLVKELANALQTATRLGRNPWAPSTVMLKNTTNIDMVNDLGVSDYEIQDENNHIFRRDF